MTVRTLSLAGSRGTRALTAMPVATLSVGILIIGGWLARDRLHLTAEFGLGYALGVVGLSMMLLLLMYSVRKRVGAMGRLGGVRHWLRIHIMLGVVGPLAILFHANFQMGSLNSTVALVCMLLVASSGVVGRLIYPRIHELLTGRRADVRELRKAAATQRSALGNVFADDPEIARELAGFEALALAPQPHAAAAIWRLVVLRTRARGVRGRILDALGDDAREVDREAVDGYLDAVRSAAEFGGYERLFSLWHAFHLPLCIMLFVAAAVHVLAVHMY